MTDVPPFAHGEAPDGPMPLEAVFARAWSLLRANWSVAVPPVVVVTLAVLLLIPAVATLMSGLWAHGTHIGQVDASVPATPPPAWALISLAAGDVVLLCGSVCAIVMTFAMADAAWNCGAATFAEGFVALRTRSKAITSASAGLVGVGFLALLLALPTLGLSMIAVVVFTMYVLPAAIGGGRTGFAAIAESYRLVRSTFVRSAIGIALLIAVQYALSLAAYPALLPLIFPFLSASRASTPGAALPLPSVPLLIACGTAYLVITLASFAYYGYFALVLVGMYRSLVGRGELTGMVVGPAARAPGAGAPGA